MHKRTSTNEHVRFSRTGSFASFRVCSACYRTIQGGISKRIARIFTRYTQEEGTDEACFLSLLRSLQFDTCWGVCFVAVTNVELTVMEELLRGGVSASCCGVVVNIDCTQRQDEVELPPDGMGFVVGDTFFGDVEFGGLVDSLEGICCRFRDCCCVAGDFGDSGATIEGILSDTCYAIGNSDRGKTRATIESIISDACYAIGNSDRGETGATRESRTSDTCYAIEDSGSFTPLHQGIC